MTSPYTGLADRRLADRRTLAAADASGAHFQRKAAEQRADMLAEQLADAVAQVGPLETRIEKQDADLAIALAALEGVIAVADRATVEFDRARAAIATLRGGHLLPKRLVIAPCGPGFDVTDEAGRCCDGLAWDEMIGQVALLTVPVARVGNGYAMHTPEQWIAMREERQRRIDARRSV